jgi:hypothetical protein
VLLDSAGRAIERRKQYGFLREPVEYVAVEPAAADGDLELVDAIGSRFDFPDDEVDES